MGTPKRSVTPKLQPHLNNMLSAIVIAATQSAAFVPSSSLVHHAPAGSLRMGLTAPTKSRPTMSKAVPFLRQPYSCDGTMPGDFGFDPLNLGIYDLTVASAYNRVGANDGFSDRSTSDIMKDYREAELKHGRLAMLAAIAWPVQELLQPFLAAKLNLPNQVYEQAGMNPSLINGGLDHLPMLATLTSFFALAAALEAKGLAIKKEQGDDWMPGDLQVDPLLLWANADDRKKFLFRSEEVMAGRAAMLAVTAYVAQEAITKIPVFHW